MGLRKRASHAYGIMNGNKEGLIGGGAALAPGHSREATSFRVECGEALATILVILGLQISRGGELQSLSPIKSVLTTPK